MPDLQNFSPKNTLALRILPPVVVVGIFSRNASLKVMYRNQRKA